MPSSSSRTRRPRSRRRSPWLLFSAAGLLVVTLIVAANFLGGPGTGEAGGFRNLLLVTFDTTRFDHLGCYGNPKADTANLDRLAGEGVLFERCISTAPLTLPSHSSILTGLYPFHHGARNNGTHTLAADVPTLAETLSQAGFATGAVVSSLVLDSRYGLDRGFDQYDDDLSHAKKAPLFMFRETTAEETSRRAVRWLQDRGGERFFLWVHFFDPHANYEPPEPFRTRFKDSPYDGEIAYADAGLGNVLESLRRKGELDRTLIVFTADHGESLGEHGETTHSLFLYDATTHVPLLFRHPALAKNKRVAEVVSSTDIVPTVLDLLGVEGPGDYDGVSLAGALLDPGAGAPPGRKVYSEAMNSWFNHGWSDLRGIRTKEYRYVRAPREEFYDLFRDGRETDNLFNPKDPDVRELKNYLAGLLAGGERDSRGDDIRSMDPKTRDALAELGYVWTADSPEPPADPSKLRDPKDGVRALEEAQVAHQLVRLERYDEAEAALRKVLSEDPDSTLSQSALVSVLLKLGKREEAKAILARMVARPTPPVTSLLRLAGLEREDGQATWTALLAKAKEIAPRDPLPWVREGDWEQDSEKPEAALIAYRKALDIDPACAKAWVGIGNSRHRQGQEEQAAEALHKAVEVDPLSFEALYNLGVVAESQKDPAAAERWYLAALEQEPDQVVALVNLANLYLQTGHPKQAEEYFRKALKADADDFNARFDLGVLLVRNGRLEEAAAEFAEACRIEPERPEAWRNRLAVCRKLDRNEEGLQSAAAILALQKDDLPALAAQAVLLEREGKADEALQTVSRTVAANASWAGSRAQKDPEFRALLERFQAAAGDG